MRYDDRRRRDAVSTGITVAPLVVAAIAAGVLAFEAWHRIALMLAEALGGK